MKERLEYSIAAWKNPPAARSPEEQKKIDAIAVNLASGALTITPEANTKEGTWIPTEKPKANPSTAPVFNQVKDLRRP